MTLKFHRDRFTWLAYLFLAFYGYLLNALGPITPFLKDELGLSYTVSSLHFTAFAIGILLAGLFGDQLVQRTGRRRALWLGAAGMSLGAWVLVLGRSPAITIGACLLMGLVGSLILAIVPVALSDRHGDLRAVALSEANVIASLVSSAAPVLVGWFARITGDWRPALWIVALTPILMYLIFRTAASGEAATRSEASAASDAPLPARFWAYWVALVLAVSVEFCMILWSADYLENVFGMAKANAALGVSLFLAGMIIGRLAASRLVQLFSARRLVLLSVLLAAAGFLVYWRTESQFFGLAGLFVTGLGVAGLYPLILARAIASAENSVQAGARATLASGTAILALPLLLGRLADAVGIQPAYGVVLVLLLGVFVIIQIADK